VFLLETIGFVSTRIVAFTAILIAFHPTKDVRAIVESLAISGGHVFSLLHAVRKIAQCDAAAGI
jgi:hypothetical protein